MNTPVKLYSSRGGRAPGSEGRAVYLGPVGWQRKGEAEAEAGGERPHAPYRRQIGTQGRHAPPLLLPSPSLHPHPYLRPLDDDGVGGQIHTPCQCSSADQDLGGGKEEEGGGAGGGGRYHCRTTSLPPTSPTLCSNTYKMTPLTPSTTPRKRISPSWSDQSAACRRGGCRSRCQTAPRPRGS